MTANTGMLANLKILDLTNEMGLLCGKLLADLGAEVIKLEKPGGDTTRNIGPYFNDETHSEKSLFWFAYNEGKKAITLDFTKPDGQQIFKQLVNLADVVIETNKPGYLDALGLGYSELEKINPKIIMVSITPYGQKGLYSNYVATDINIWAMGGYMYPFGDEDRAPVRISHHSQSFLHAGAGAAAATTLALYYREIKGNGQHVDISIQECVARIDMTHKWDMLGINLKRGEWLTKQQLKTRYIWPCKDGFIMWNYWIGPAAMLWGTAFSDWVIADGFADDFYKNIKWAELDGSTPEGLQMIEEVVSRATKPTVDFLMSHTKAELFEGAQKRNLMLYPLSDVKDINENRQLKARDFWKSIEHPELGVGIVYPGAWAKCEESPIQILTRAPHVGEHNREIYVESLGLTEDSFNRLKNEGTI